MSVDAKSTTDAPHKTNPLRDVNAIQRDLLFAIDDVERHGSPRDKSYEFPTGQCIKTALEEWQGYDTTTPQYIYSNLDKLADAGYVEKGDINGRTNGYVLTPKGLEELVDYTHFVAGE